MVDKAALKTSADRARAQAKLDAKAQANANLHGAIATEKANANRIGSVIDIGEPKSSKRILVYAIGAAIVAGFVWKYWLKKRM